MKMDSVYGNIKLNNYNKVVIIKCGSFYRSYENDALILWKAFGYKINNNMVSFPVTTLGSIVGRLNRLGISVVVSNKDSVINYETTLEDNYYKYLDSAIKGNDINEKLNELKNKVSEKLEKDEANYKLISDFLEKL